MSDTGGAAPAAKRAKVARRPQSAKGKGRRLQQQAAAALVESFKGVLEADDVISRPMGSQGGDLMLSPLARRALPYDFEMKNVEAFNLWPTLDQAWSRCSEGLVPCVVAKRNNRPPVAIVPFGDWCELVRVSSNVVAQLPFGRTASCDEITACCWGTSAAPVPLPQAQGVDAKGRPKRPGKADIHVALLQHRATEALRCALNSGDVPANPVQPSLQLNTVMVHGVGPVRFEGSSRFCFWDVWHDHLLQCGARDTEVLPKQKRPPRCALVMDRGDAALPIYAALPFEDLVAMLRRRWDAQQAAAAEAVKVLRALASPVGSQG